MGETLYRYFGGDDRLLYVGITRRGHRRANEHARAAWWAKQVRMTSEHFASRAEVEEAEREAIRAESPLYNVSHKPPRCPTGRYENPVWDSRRSAPVGEDRSRDRGDHAQGVSGACAHPRGRAGGRI